MNTTLIIFVVLYLLVTIAIGIYAGTRVKSTADFAIAGRSLPLIMIVTTTFATWFGSETVLGISAKFVQGGLGAVVEDPFGASFCLIFVGLFFAYKLYQMTLLTIGDYYRTRYGKKIEIVCSAVIILSYLGWVAAQVTALGLVFNLLTDGYISRTMGMVIGLVSVLVYVYFGGFLAVAWTDFIQMIVLVCGLIAIAVVASNLAGGSDKVFALAKTNNWWNFWPEPKFKDVVFFMAAGMTMMLGSIPQQDVFQRVMAAKDAATARKGPIIGGLAYLGFAFVPMFIVACATLAIPDVAKTLLKDDPQKLLPTFIMTQMPLLMQILFFGALLSAIKSTSSATLLAPTTSFVENIWKNMRPGMTDQQQLMTMRITLVIFSGLVLTYAIVMEGTPIYELVSSAYQVTLVGAFIPLVCGLYWSRATTQGALLSMVFGFTTWIIFLISPKLGFTFAAEFPGQLAGLIAAAIGIVAGSLMPQWIGNEGDPTNAPNPAGTANPAH